MDCCRLCIRCCCDDSHGGHGGHGGHGHHGRGYDSHRSHGSHGSHHSSEHCSCGDCSLNCGKVSDCDCGNCDLSCGDCGGCDCDCGDLGGGGEVLIACFCLAVVFLLPIIVLACIALPFWYLAQYLASKLGRDTPFWVTVIVFIVVFVIPSCFIWYALFSAVCENADGDGWAVVCYVWHIVQLVLSI